MPGDRVATIWHCSSCLLELHTGGALRADELRPDEVPVVRPKSDPPQNTISLLFKRYCKRRPASLPVGNVCQMPERCSAGDRECLPGGLIGQ